MQIHAMCRGVALFGCTLIACEPTEPATAPPKHALRAEPASKPVPKVANPDARGVTDQPDYDRQALAVRSRVGPKLPAQRPTSQQACNAMLDAANEFYGVVEVEPEARVQIASELQATRGDELNRCQAGLSPEAALCVTLLLSERDTEYPWLVDQCARAFPKNEPGKAGQAKQFDLGAERVN